MGPKKHHSFFKFKGLKYFTYFAAGSFVFLYIFMGTQGLDVDAVQAYSSNGRRITAANISNEVDVVTEAVSADEQAANTPATGGGGDRSNFLTIFQGPWDAYAVPGKAISNPHGDRDYVNGQQMSMAGCGVASTAMVVRNYTGDDQWDCHTIAMKYNAAGLACPSQDTAPITQFFNDKYPEFGLKATYHSASDTMTPDKIDAVLAQGGYIIVDKHQCYSCANGALFASGGDGHYVVIYAGNKNDGYRIGDSNSSHQHPPNPYYDRVFTKEEAANCTSQTRDYWYSIVPN